MLAIYFKEPSEIVGYCHAIIGFRYQALITDIDHILTNDLCHL